MIINNDLRGKTAYNKNVKNFAISQNPKHRDNQAVSASFSRVPVSVFKAYHNIVSFGRSKEEHDSWGPNFDAKNSSVSFKIPSFSDAKKVYVEVMDKNADPGCNFAEMDNEAQGARGIGVEHGDNGEIKKITSVDDNSKMYELNNEGKGVFSIKDIPAKDGDRYRFVIVKGDNNIEKVKDPYAYRQEDLLGWSTVYDQNKYEWKNSDWFGDNWWKKHPERVSREVGHGKGLGALRIMEVNIPTLTKDGTFESAKEKIDEIVDKNLANAIEIMPVDGTFAPGWTYDGVDKFAVNEQLGGPDKLKELVDYAHGKGINVIMDIVPNHIGPDGDMLARTGPYEAGHGAFGSRINCEGKDNEYVRDWLSNMALRAAEHYHVDGLRLDSTKSLNSDLTLRQIVGDVHEHYPDVFTIAEDIRNNDSRITTPLNLDGKSHEDFYEQIEKSIKGIEEHNACPVVDSVGFDSEWDFNLYFALMNAIQGLGQMNDFDNSLKHSGKRVKYFESHDEVKSNRRTLVNMMNYALTGDKQGWYNPENPDYNHERNLDNTKKLLDDLVSGKIQGDDRVKNAFNFALATYKLSLGTIYSVPGPRMIYQGDEKGEAAPLKFFQKFSNYKYSNNPQEIEDKYNKDLNSSKIGEMEINGEYKDVFSKIERFNKDLNELVDNSFALQYGDISETHMIDGTHSHVVEKDGEEYFVVKNLCDRFFWHNLRVSMPKGEWEEIINSDDSKYAGSGNFMNPNIVKSVDNDTPISISANSISIFKKVG